ncbi:hypothetical protein WA1_18755 [Scytonema hofmannii PCC 7110]|uniref:HTH cro/C1-type domain-containing protein n=2 Tax=Scytonema hofmannii TaxID=34078 RepID=A0A139XBL9_9CYAN|nr:hypothetical protein WA1_18755 [Scytonema hofmannii PCC 7110]
MDAESRARLVEAIKHARGNRSQRKFASDLGVSYATVQSWERGTVIPDLENLEAVATARGQSLEQLLAQVRAVGSEEVHKPKKAEDLLLTIRQLSREEVVRLIKLLIDEI